MKTHTITLAVELAGGSLPTEFRLFAAGENSSTKGTFLVDEKAVAAVMAAYRKHGISRLPIDYEHRQLDPNAPVSEQVAAGSFVPEDRAGEIWATDVRWTPRAAKELQDGERMYFSPAFECDPKTKRVRRLINIALTNLPALDNLPALVAAKAVPYAAGPIDESSGWDGGAAERSVRAWATNGADIDWEKYRQAFAWYDAEAPDVVGSYKLGHHEVQGDELVVSRAGVMAAAAALQGSRGGVDLPESEQDAVKNHIAQHYAAMKMAPPWEAKATEDVPPIVVEVEGRASAEREMSLMDKTILTVLSLKEDAPETEVLAAVSRMRDERAELLRLAGVDSIEAFNGAIVALKSAADRVPALEQELVTLKARDTERERDAFIETNKQKFAPAMRDWAKTQSLESLRAFVAVAPDLVVLGQEPAQPPVDKIELTADEKRVARSVGLTDEQFAAHKALLAKEGV